MAVGVPGGIRGRCARFHEEGNAELLQRGAELGDVVAVHEVVGVLVEQVDRGAGEDDVHGGLAGHDTQRDAHGLVGAVGDARILRDQHEHGVAGCHAS